MADLLTNLAAAAGAAGGDGAYIEDVFSTYLYTGTGAAQTITNGIDLDGEGGLVWIKSRSNSEDNALVDTVRGGGFVLRSNATTAQQDKSGDWSSFNSDGFTVNGGEGLWSVSTYTYASWTFRKALKFFDIVTYTGTNSVGSQTLSHSLGSVPGSIIVKRTDSAGNWRIFHRSLGATQALAFTTGAAGTSSSYWNDTAPTDTQFTVGPDLNDTGATFVAYLFAHDDGGFGDDGEQNVITCGSLTQASAVDVAVSLGYEPQWVLVKQTNTTGQWNLLDDMRGFLAGSNSVSSRVLRPNLSNAEADFTIQKTATGFTWPSGQYSSGTQTYIYIAIRRGPMKTPTAGTEVYKPVAYTGDGSTRAYSVGFPIDLSINMTRTVQIGDAPTWDDRLRGSRDLYSNATQAETAVSSASVQFDNQTNLIVPSYRIASGTTYIDWVFVRAPGFFDVVCYTGTGSATTFAHNLGVVPELMIVKNRSDATGRAWAVYAGDNTDYLVLNTTAATADDNTYWNDTSPTASVFTVGTNNSTNESGDTFVAYLFASLAGVSDIGTYTGNGTSVSVTTGFQPRFILVKRTDSTGNWYVGDSARGLVAGDDPFLELNTSDLEVTNEDWVDVSATGFTVNETAANANVSTATYIYLAIS
jgi:hypothetical protein